MKQIESPRPPAASRKALRRRVTQMYGWLNQGALAKCFALIDPRLREEQRIELQTYMASQQEFVTAYGKIEPWYIRISLHLAGAANKKDARPFAYVYVVWRDQAQRFHLFRERWVQDSGQWYTRVVGLVANEKAAAAASD